jgi:hypothetical protein
VDMQYVLDAMWEHLLPAFGPDPLDGRASADAELAERMSRLTLPPSAGTLEPSSAGWSGVSFAPEGGASADQPTLTGVTLAAREPDGWTVSLIEATGHIDLPLGSPGWTINPGDATTPPTAVSGGWTDADTLAFDVAFLETPHRLGVTCSLARGTFTARWHTAPLHGGPLTPLRAPRT